MKRIQLMGPVAVAMAIAAGCGGDDAVPDGGGNGGGGGQPPASEVISLMVDTNRDGLVNEDDDEGEELWDSTHGASFLPNLDDDNLDGVQDANDAVANITPDNNIDFFDLAPMLVKAWPKVPAGATGTLGMDALSVPHVRVFKLLPDQSWQLVMGADKCLEQPPDCAPASTELSNDEIKAGVLLGVEGLRPVGLPTSVSPDGAGGEVPWTGIVDLELSVWEAGASSPITNPTNPDGYDRVKMRVAPWIVFGNLTPTIDTMFSNTVSTVFVQGVEAATTDAGINYWKISNWSDHWTEDWMFTGFASVPAPDGQVHGMRLAIPRPWGRTDTDAGLPINWLLSSKTGIDMGTFVVYKKPHTGNSYDSYGNHDLVPPYEHDGKSYPYGRIVYGTSILPETAAFYEAQLVQAPALVPDTSWLIVGHIDEAVTYVPAATERGWKLLVGSPSLAKQLLEQWQKDGFGAEMMFVGKKLYGGKAAEISIDDVLADADLMQWSQEAQIATDGIVELFKSEVGLTEDELVYIPYLYEAEKYGGEWLKVAYNPGTVNSRFFHDYCIAPDPFGPKINGVDGFKKDFDDRVGTSANALGKDGQGLKVFYADNWDMYHRLLGEVHCGTNQEGPPQVDIKWWEAMQ